MIKAVKVRDRLVGDGQPSFVIAEAGSNHNGKLEQALRLVDVAADAGADAVKFQLFRASKLYTRKAGSTAYLKEEKPIFDLIAEMEMPYDWLPRLVERCRERQIAFMASAFDEESLERLDPFVDLHKIASYEMTHAPLVRAAGRTGKPTVISTGTGDLAEVAETLHAFASTGNPGLMLMQCTAAYPAPLDSIELLTIPTMKAEFRVPVGLSDHSRHPLVAPLGAVAVGANILEKHFTFSNELPGPDHKFALEPAELREMVCRVRDLEKALGSGEKKVQAAELELRRFARRSIFAVRNIARGETFTTESIAVLRCGAEEPGLEPALWETVLGKRATRDIEGQTAVRPGDYE